MNASSSTETVANVFQAKPWLKFYEDHVPEFMDYPNTNLPEVLSEKARQFPDNTAIIFKDRRISYKEYDRAVNQTANILRKFGVQKGDRVAIHLPNCPQFAFSFFAILRLGAVVVPCNPTYKARELAHQLNDSGAGIIITLSAVYPLVKQASSVERILNFSSFSLITV